jgi:hypothetical protein
MQSGKKEQAAPAREAIVLPMRVLNASHFIFRY